MDRRTFLRSAGAAGAASLAGCLNYIGRRGPIAFTSMPAYIEPDAVEESAYRYDGIRNFGFDQMVTIDGRERELDVDSWVTRYQRVEQYEGLFSYVDIFSTPNPTFQGKSLNPLVEAPAAELVSTVGENSPVTVERVIETRTIKLFGEEHTVEKLKGSVKENGMSVGAFIVLLRTVHKGDAVIGISVYADFENQDQLDDIVSLYSSIVHPADKETVESVAGGNETAPQ